MIALQQPVTRPGQSGSGAEVRDDTLPVYAGARDAKGAFLAALRAVAGVFSGVRVEFPFHIDEAQLVQLTISSGGEFSISGPISGAALVLHRVEGFGKQRLAPIVLGR